MSCATLVKNLAIELASELDLHYEADDYPRLGPTFVHLAAAQLFLESSGLDVPEEVRHIIKKFRQAQN